MWYVSSKLPAQIFSARSESVGPLGKMFYILCVAILMEGCSQSATSLNEGLVGGGNSSSLVRQVGAKPIPVYVLQVSSWLPSGTFGADSVIDIDVIFSAPVVLADGANPKILLNTTPPRIASYVSGSGSNRLSFQYEVQAGDQGPKLDYVDSGSLISDNGGLLDLGGSPVNLVLSSPGSEGSLSQFLTQGKGVTVGGSDAGPVLSSSASSVSVVSSSVVSVTVSDSNTGAAFDQSGSPITFSCAFNGGLPCDQLPGHAFSFDSSTGFFKWIPSQALEGQTFRVTVAGVSAGAAKLAGSVTFVIAVQGQGGRLSAAQER